MNSPDETGTSSKTGDGTLLITLTGKDRPGVTSRTMQALAAHELNVLDLEQIVLRGRLVLGFLVTAPVDPVNVAHLSADLTRVAAEVDMTLDIEPGTGDTRPRSQGRNHVTVLGSPLTAAAVAGITRRIAEAGGNIDRIERMARYPVTAIELSISGTQPDELRPVLSLEAARQGVDIAVQAANLMRRSLRLIVMDVDSTLIQGEVIEMIAAHAGCEAQVAAVTERAMNGELDFAESLRARVSLLEGVSEAVLDEVYDNLILTPGARTTIRTLKRLGYRFAIVSGGFTQITNRLATSLGIDFAAANELEIVDGRLTGRVVGEIVDRAGKAAALRRFAEQLGLPLAATIAIGDGANDLDMLNVSGLGIAFNAKPIVREEATTAVNVPYLDTIMYLLGISREEIEAADAAVGITTPAPPLP